MKKFSLFILKSISRLPFGFHRFLSFVLYVFLNYFFKYRKAVIDQNLANSYPNISEKERRKIRKKFYKYFADFIVETLKLLTISEKGLRKRVKFTENALKQVADAYDRGQNIIALSGHVFNWEFCCLAPVFMRYKVLVSYKILKSPFWEKVVRDMREKYGGEAVDFRKTYPTILRYQRKDQLTLTWICGDQMPSWERNALTEEEFLGQRTYFFKGINDLAKRTNSYVLFVDVQRKGRFRYLIDAKKITDQPKDELETFVTQRYSKILENLIAKDPANWLWSHKRWKKVPGAD